MVQAGLDPSRVLYATSVSLLDCIFLDGHGDAAFAVRHNFVANETTYN